MTPTTTCQPTTVADLAQAGFTPEQIERLSLLRDVYPLLEFLETAEVRRLSFMKWRLEHVRSERS